MNKGFVLASLCGLYASKNVLISKTYCSWFDGESKKEDKEDDTLMARVAKEFAKYEKTVRERMKKEKELVSTDEIKRYGILIVPSFIAGYGSRKFLKMSVLTVGGVCVLWQFANYHGYIESNYEQMEKDLIDLLNLNKYKKKDESLVSALHQKYLKMDDGKKTMVLTGFMVGFFVASF